MTNPGDIVIYDGERRVVTDVGETGDHENYAVLRYVDGDPRREVDSDGGDMHFDAAPADSLTVVGHL